MIRETYSAEGRVKEESCKDDVGEKDEDSWR